MWAAQGENHHGRRERYVLVVSGLAGGLVGVTQAHWQWSVEHAQVLAGIVSYPTTSPVAIAHAKFWSLLPQLGALLLSAGVTEWALSIAISGLMGVLAFQGLSAVGYALSRDELVAIGAVFVLFASRAYDYGVVYPISLLGTPDTYGAVGLMLLVQVIGLFALRWYRTAAFLLAISPAIHVTLGLWLLAVIGGASVAIGGEPLAALRRAWKFFAAGATITLVSFIAQRMLAPDIPPIDEATAATYFHAFVPFWDGHRRPAGFLTGGMFLNLSSTVLAAVWLLKYRRSMPDAVQLLLGVMVVSGVAGFGVAVWSRLPDGWMPVFVIRAIPNRVLNLNIVLAGAVAFGLAGTLRPAWASRAVLLVTAAGLLLSSQSSFWWLVSPGNFSVETIYVLAAAMAALLVAGALSRHRLDVGASQVSAGAGRDRARRGSWLRPTLAAVFAVALILTVMGPGRFEHGPWNAWKRDAVLQRASEGHGLLLTGGDLFMIQLRTRRPVVLDGMTLDTLPYALEAGPVIDRILREVYQIDLFHPPREAWGGGRVPRRANQRAWEAIDPARWQEIGRTYDVSEIVTPANWKLQLPHVAQSSEFELYRIVQ